MVLLQFKNISFLTPSIVWFMTQALRSTTHWYQRLSRLFFQQSHGFVSFFLFMFSLLHLKMSREHMLQIMMSAAECCKNNKQHKDKLAAHNSQEDDSRTVSIEQTSIGRKSSKRALIKFSSRSISVSTGEVAHQLMDVLILLLNPRRPYWDAEWRAV